MPGDESSTSGGEAKMTANDLSNFVVKRDARILEVKKKELDFMSRVSDIYPIKYSILNERTLTDV